MFQCPIGSHQVTQLGTRGLPGLAYTYQGILAYTLIALSGYTQVWANPVGSAKGPDDVTRRQSRDTIISRWINQDGLTNSCVSWGRVHQRVKPRGLLTGKPRWTFLSKSVQKRPKGPACCKGITGRVAPMIVQAENPHGLSTAQMHRLLPNLDTEGRRTNINIYVI
eukprot:jgi/Botrbrau1/4620/Bobra.60_2s0103.1